MSSSLPPSGPKFHLSSAAKNVAWGIVRTDVELRENSGERIGILMSMATGVAKTRQKHTQCLCRRRICVTTVDKLSTIQDPNVEVRR